MTNRDVPRAGGAVAERPSTGRPPFRAAVAVAFIEQGRCPCWTCNGSLARSDRWPSWRRCVDCGCHWTISEISGRRREGLFASPTCPARRPQEAEGA